MTELTVIGYYTGAVGLASGAAGAALVRAYGETVSLVDLPTERSSHHGPTPRGAGVGVLAAFVFAGVFLAGDPMLTLTGLTAGLVGMAEDRFELSARLRLVLELVIALALVVWWRGLVPEGQAIALAGWVVFWTIFITGTSNFFNFMDGIDGISGGSAAVGFSLMGVYSGLYGTPEITLTCVAITASALGFLPFNLSRRKVFLGDVGSLLLGFVFAAFVLRLSSGPWEFVCISMFFAPYYADALLTLFIRMSSGRSVTTAHRGHLYQYLANDLSIPHWKVSAIYGAVQLITGAGSLVAYSRGPVYQSLLLGVFIAGFTVAYLAVKGPGAARRC